MTKFLFTIILIIIGFFAIEILFREIYILCKFIKMSVFEFGWKHFNEWDWDWYIDRIMFNRPKED